MATQLEHVTHLQECESSPTCTGNKQFLEGFQLIGHKEHTLVDGSFQDVKSLEDATLGQRTIVPSDHTLITQEEIDNLMAEFLPLHFEDDTGSHPVESHQVKALINRGCAESYKLFNFCHKTLAYVADGTEVIQSYFNNMVGGDKALIAASVILHVLLISSGVGSAFVPGIVEKCFELAGKNLQHIDMLNRYLEHNYILPMVDTTVDMTNKAACKAAELALRPFIGPTAAYCVTQGTYQALTGLVTLGTGLYDHIITPVEDALKDQVAYPLVITLMKKLGSIVGTSPIAIHLLTAAFAMLAVQGILAIADIAKTGILAYMETEESYLEKIQEAVMNASATAENAV